ncbi:hypothetical protein Tco_0722380, partial [Tanacetum coccineum]
KHSTSGSGSGSGIGNKSLYEHWNDTLDDDHMMMISTIVMI